MKKITRAQQFLARCLNRWRTDKEHRQGLAKVELETLSSLLEIRDQVKSRTWHLYQKAYSMGLTRGIQRELPILALIYYASMEAGNPLQLKEICKKTGANKKALFSTYTKLKREMGLENIIRKADDLLQKFGNKVGATQPKIEEARKLLEKGDFHSFSPSIAASASLLAAMDEYRVTRSIAQKFNVGHTALRNALKRHKKSHAFRCLAPQINRARSKISAETESKCTTTRCRHAHPKGVASQHSSLWAKALVHLGRGKRFKGFWAFFGLSH